MLKKVFQSNIYFMDYEFIDCIEIEPSIRRIFLNRPNKRNALCNPLRKELLIV